MKCNFNQEISKYGVFRVEYRKLVFDPFIQSIKDYNHSIYELHHYIVFQSFSKNKDWYKDRGIEQKLILLPRDVHRNLHTCRDDFDYKGFKWFELLFCRKKSDY